MEGLPSDVSGIAVKVGERRGTVHGSFGARPLTNFPLRLLRKPKTPPPKRNPQTAFLTSQWHGFGLEPGARTITFC